MSDQEMNMNEEKKPNIKKLMPEGWQSVKITECTESKSKAGNLMFITELTFKEQLGYSENIYLVGEQGKRWMLKKLLSACGIEAAADGIYKWNPEEIIGKEIRVLVEHEDNEYIDRNGNEVKRKQNRFTDFEILAWDDND